MNESIVLYSTGCPACNMLKLMLNKAEIEYVENNSAEDILELGFTQAPVLLVDGKYLNFNEAKKWLTNNRKGESI